MTTKEVKMWEILDSNSLEGLFDKLNSFLYINTLALESGETRITDKKLDLEIHNKKYAFEFRYDLRLYPLTGLQFDTLYELAVSSTKLLDLREHEKLFYNSVAYHKKKSIDALLPLGMVQKNAKNPMFVELSGRARSSRYSANIVNYPDKVPKPDKYHHKFRTIPVNCFPNYARV